MNHFLNPPHFWQGAMYWPAKTPGTLIRALKQQYLPSEQTRFLELLCKRVKTNDSLSKLPNEPFFFLNPPHYWQRDHIMASCDPWDSHWSPQTTMFAPRTNQFSLAAYQEGKTSNSPIKTAKWTIFFLSPPHPWQGSMYQPAGTGGTLIRAPKQEYFPPKQTSLPEPLSERVKSSDFLSKLPNE